jgi:1,4-dihydroxy-2-naphthoate octaprenyltransferase
MRAQAATGWRVWLGATRPRTLPAAVAPVLVGTAAAAAGPAGVEAIVAWRAGAALVVALALQVAVNFANDAFDAERGVDTAQRVGPTRAVATGRVSASAMKGATAAVLAVAGGSGLALAAVTTWWLLAVGLACALAALGYSGGPKPYASVGLGEAFVFVFFGLVATVGSAFVHLEEVTATAVVAAVPVGLVAVALLVVNNLRDVSTDAAAGKATLAVRLGEPATRWLFAGLVGGAVGIAVLAPPLWPPLAVAAAPLAWPAVRPVLAGARGSALVGVLKAVSRLHLALAGLLAAALVIG